jgi:hypothetical protein
VQIEELADALERCRKTALASKVALGLGGMLMAATTPGVITFDALVMIAGFAALLGGVVVFGSNMSTANQPSDSMRSAEAQRAALSGQLDIRLVADAPANLSIPNGAKYQSRSAARRRANAVTGYAGRGGAAAQQSGVSGRPGEEGNFAPDRPACARGVG